MRAPFRGFPLNARGGRIDPTQNADVRSSLEVFVRRNVVVLTAAVALLSAFGFATAGPASATSATPSDLYYIGASGASCTNSATNQRFQDAGGTQIPSNPGLVAAAGYTVTVHNRCTSTTIYVGYGQAGGAAARSALAGGASATYTIGSNGTTVQAYDDNTGSGNLLAVIYVVAPPDVTASGSNSSTTLSTSTISTAVNSVFSIQNNGSDTLTVANLTGSVSWFGPSCISTTCTIPPTSSKSLPVTSQGTVRVGNATLTIGSGGGGTDSSSTESAPTETLSLAVAASGATCTGGNPTGYAGSWLTLPGADQCSQSGPTAKSGAKLLGWATSANFPVARAQAQIDKKWGVIDEVIDGQRMIFIPGGMATFVSGSNTLFPIWSA